MKILTHSERMGVVVEFNADEYRALGLLIKAVEGKDFGDAYTSSFESSPQYIQTDFDMTTAFGVVKAFYETMFQVNTLQAIVNKLRLTIENHARL